MIQPKILPGSILRVFRGLYFHYGVYVGNGKVVHFCSTGDNELDSASADIIETSLSRFSKGDFVSVDTQEKPLFEGEEIVRRARMSIGTKLGTYNLLSNNCEHFANWCRCGKLVSHQKNFVDSVINELLPSGSVGRQLKDIAFSLFSQEHKSLQSVYDNQLSLKNK